MTNNKHIQLVLEEIRHGYPVLVSDNDDREDETDIMVATPHLTKDWAAFFMREVRGIFCVTAPEAYFQKAGIPRSPSNSGDRWATPFTLTFDAVEGTTTGVSATEKVITAKKLIHPDTKPGDLCYPGHVNGLIPRNGLLKERTGHTELCTWLALMATNVPSATIAELVRSDGEMARGVDAQRFAEKFGFLRVTTKQILQYSEENNLWPTL